MVSSFPMASNAFGMLVIARCKASAQITSHVLHVHICNCLLDTYMSNSYFKGNKPKTVLSIFSISVNVSTV
jgi:hypothetical protein